jgi:hypothetical protein
VTRNYDDGDNNNNSPYLVAVSSICEIRAGNVFGARDGINVR